MRWIGKQCATQRACVEYKNSYWPILSRVCRVKATRNGRALDVCFFDWKRSCKYWRATISFFPCKQLGVRRYGDVLFSVLLLDFVTVKFSALKIHFSPGWIHHTSVFLKTVTTTQSIHASARPVPPVMAIFEAANSLKHLSSLSIGSRFCSVAHGTKSLLPVDGVEMWSSHSPCYRHVHPLLHAEIPKL